MAAVVTWWWRTLNCGAEAEVTVAHAVFWWRTLHSMRLALDLATQQWLLKLKRLCCCVPLNPPSPKVSTCLLLSSAAVVDAGRLAAAQPSSGPQQTSDVATHANALTFLFTFALFYGMMLPTRAK